MRGVLTQDEFHSFVRRKLFVERGFDIDDVGKNQFVARSHEGIVGTVVGPRQECLVATAVSDEEETYKAARDVARSPQQPVAFFGLERVDAEAGDTCFDALDLEVLFYPLIIERMVGGLIVPIRQAYASTLLPRTEQPQMLQPTRVQLRTDNVYYRYPNCYRHLRRGSPIFFYETARGTGRSRLIGEGKVTGHFVETPQDLFARYRNLGVYTLEQMEHTAGKSGPNEGKVLAISFDWYQQFDRPLTLDHMREVLPTFNGRSARQIDFEQARALRRLANER